MEQHGTWTLLKEFKRKSIHLFSLIIPILYYKIPDENLSRILLLTATLLLLVIDVIKLRHKNLRKLYMNVSGKVLRDFESRTLVGATYFLIACSLSVFLFEKRAATAAIVFLVLGDTAAALFGKAYGKIKILNKSLEGSIACFLVCFFSSFAIPELPVGAGLAGAAAATLAEIFPFPLDDNFRIPLFSGTIVQLILNKG